MWKVALGHCKRVSTALVYLEQTTVFGGAIYLWGGGEGAHFYSKPLTRRERQLLSTLTSEHE